MKLYLAGPMTGRPDHNFRAFFLAEAMLTMKGHTVVNPALLDLEEGVAQWSSHEQRIVVLPGFTRKDAMRRDVLAMASDCGAIVLLPGYESSDGAQDELRIAAKVFGYPVFLYNPETEDIDPVELEL